MNKCTWKNFSPPFVWHPLLFQQEFECTICRVSGAGKNEHLVPLFPLFLGEGAALTFRKAGMEAWEQVCKRCARSKTGLLLVGVDQQLIQRRNRATGHSGTWFDWIPGSAHGWYGCGPTPSGSAGGHRGPGALVGCTFLPCHHACCQADGPISQVGWVGVLLTKVPLGHPFQVGIQEGDPGSQWPPCTHGSTRDLCRPAVPHMPCLPLTLPCLHSQGDWSRGPP